MPCGRQPRPPRFLEEASATSWSLMPSPGAKLFAMSRSHCQLPDPICVKVLHLVMEGTTLPPYSCGRVEEWLFNLMCQEMCGTRCCSR